MPAIIDVHGLKVKEAIKQTERKLREVQLTGGKKLEVITGRGRHSKNGIPVLKVSVMQALHRCTSLSSRRLEFLF